MSKQLAFYSNRQLLNELENRFPEGMVFCGRRTNLNEVTVKNPKRCPRGIFRIRNAEYTVAHPPETVLFDGLITLLQRFSDKFYRDTELKKRGK